MSSPTPDHSAASDRKRVPEGRPSGARSRRPLVLAVAGTVIGLLGLAWVAGYLVAGDQLPKNARVAGVAVGGLDRKQAIERLTSELEPRSTQPIKVTVGSKSAEIAPETAGLRVDYPASIDAAGGGRSVDPRRIVKVLTGGRDRDAVVITDQPALNVAVEKVAESLDQDPVDAAVAYQDTSVQQGKAEQGLQVQSPAAAKAVRAGYLSDVPVELPTEVTEPKVSDAEAKKVVATIAEPAVADDVTVKAGAAGSFSLSPQMIASSSTFVADGGTLKLKLDADELESAAKSVLKKVELTKPKDATVRLRKGRPEVVPAVNGTEVSASELAKAVQPALSKTGSDRTVSVELTGAKAKFSTADAEKLAIKEVTGKFTTYFPYAEYRNVNIGRAAKLINGTVLKPGDTFSLNGIVGERTRANGFTEGFIISGGKFKKDLGGGVSQSATTTYNAMFFAGLKDVQHQPHTLYIDRYPAGREATVAWPNLDLKFTNDTKYGVLVQANLVKATGSSKGSITVKMWSTKTYDKIASSALAKSDFTSGQDLTDNSADCEPMVPVQGFTTNYSRLFYQDGEVVKREKFSWRYAPTNRVTCS